MALRYVRWIERITGQLALRSTPGNRLVGVFGLLLGDMTAEGASQAVRASWIGDDDTGPASDALGPAGSELSLPRYPNETSEQYAVRLERAWEDWPYAGHQSSIIGQLEAAGFPNAEIYYASDWPLVGSADWWSQPGGFLPARSDWWSQFWVFLPAGSHTVTGHGALIGSFTVGDGTTIGPDGISAENLLALRSIILKFKPAHWICSGVIFEISSWTIGTGHTVGEVGLVIGGSQATVGVQ